MAHVNLTINGRALQADPSRTILQAAREHGIEIPTLCFDPRLPPTGSCLVCGVELVPSNRLVMSCATPVAEGMIVETESTSARKARKAAVDLLLSNHYADCRGACTLQCPARVDIQGYLAYANAGLYREALDLIRETNPLPLACGRVCVRYCEANCRRKDVDSPAAINFMKRYVADLEFGNLPIPEPVPTRGKRVAVVGGGPAGLTCAYYLRTAGVDVTIFDQQPKLGGMLRYGIPEYRLPEAVLDKEIAYLLAHGIETRTGVRLGRDFTLDSLKADGFDAIYLALGSWVAKGMGIENEQHPNILPGIVFLEGVKRNGPPRLEGAVAIVGGGNTAVDAARTALRCGAEKVSLLYRRTRAEMPADEIEIEDAVEEGVELQFLLAPRRAVLEDGKLLGLECSRMELGAPDASGRRRPVEVKDSEFLFRADWIISAIGQEQDLTGLGEIPRTRWNSIDADPATFMTSIPGVFAGGDVMTGPAAAIDAIGAGGKAARVIERFLHTGVAEPYREEFVSRREALAPMDPRELEAFERLERSAMPKLDEGGRIHTWEEVDRGVTEAQVKHETSRCLSCGCGSVFDCDLKDLADACGADQARFRGRVKKHKVDARHPYITLVSNKCILCGRCVRYCGDLLGIHALGFLHRGFETLVKPVLDKPLAETPCISCGNCIEVCPTGAIAFRMSLDKPGPFRTVAHPSICAFCGLGCQIDLNHAGRNCVYVTARPEDAHTPGELCERGRFRVVDLLARDRLASPRIKGRGQVGMADAAQYLRERLGTFRGAEILFVASPRVSCEALFLFATLAEQCGSRFIFQAADLNRPALPDPSLGSTAPASAVLDSQLLVTVGVDVVKANPVMGFRIRRALRQGARLIHVGPLPEGWTDLVTTHVACASGGEAGALADLCDRLDGGSAGAPPFPKDLRTLVLVNRDANAAGDGREVAWAARLAHTAGADLLVLRADANGEGFTRLVHGGGFSGAADFLALKRSLPSIQAVVALGCDPSGIEGLRPAFTFRMDTHAAPGSREADGLVPLCPLQEEEGYVLSCDGSLSALAPVFTPLAGFTNVDFLGETLGGSRPGAGDLAAVRAALADRIPAFRPLAEGIRETRLPADLGRPDAATAIQPWRPAASACTFESAPKPRHGARLPD